MGGVAANIISAAVFRTAIAIIKCVAVIAIFARLNGSIAARGRGAKPTLTLAGDTFIVLLATLAFGLGKATAQAIAGKRALADFFWILPGLNRRTASCQLPGLRPPARHTIAVA